MKKIKGIWIPNHPHSKVLTSKEEIITAISFLKDKGFNTIFPVVWNRGYTLYPSQVMRSYNFPEIDPYYEKQNRDPILEIITEAHRNKIKVIPWFEYGFAASHKPSGGHILKQKPHWKAINNKRETVSHGGLIWMNGLNSEVQNFTIELVLEIVNNYDIDGIQGCDRFPALPITGGYDRDTINKYQKEFDRWPPTNIKNQQWLQWRANILTLFLTNLYRQVKSIKPSLIVSLSPAVYPFGKDNLLQDSLTWVERGLVDIIHPQIYRNTFSSYRHEVQVIKRKFPADSLKKFAPGIALIANNKKLSKSDLDRCLELNERSGFCGEVIFQYETFKNYS